MTSATLASLSAPGFWDALLDRYTTRFAARPSKLRAYRDLVVSGQIRDAVDAYGAQRLGLARPAVVRLNRSGGRRKTVYLFPPREDLFLKGVNHALQPLTHLHSPLCHSFQRGRGVRTAFAAMRQFADLEMLACIHVDVREYFASISPRRLLRSLPSELADDTPLMTLLGDMLSEEEGGVLAGTPLAPLLSNLYLRPLDDWFEACGTPYLRYADDIIVFARERSLAHYQREIEERLAGLGLAVNPRKTRISHAGAAWEYLGLRHEGESIDLGSTTVAKMHHRVRRLARRARTHRNPARYVIRRLNRKLYGFGADASAFTWATWFFPLLNRDDSLRRLDDVIQEQIRFSVTGRHERRNRGAVPYAALLGSGYVPLVSAYRAYRHGRGEYESLLDRRLPGLPRAG